jgi:glucokinase
MPAFVDEAGRITGSCNLPALNGVAFPQLLESRFGLPVRMENDVSAAAYGEYYFGGHRGASRRMLFVAIGTGIGAGMVVDGSLLRVARGCLGDSGHVIVEASGNLPCRCGGNGCLEAAASGWALVERAQRLGMEATPQQIFDAGREGDSALARLAADAARAIGVGLATLAVLFSPDMIVLGGGVAVEGGEFLRARAEATMRAHAVPLFSENVRVVPAKMNRAAGLLGAAFVLFPNSA